MHIIVCVLLLLLLLLEKEEAVVALSGVRVRLVDVALIIIVGLFFIINTSNFNSVS